jgi:diacylglycerol kinase (ATP)
MNASSARRFVMIVNPNAGRGRVGHRLEEVLGLSSELKKRTRIETFRSLDDVRDIVARTDADTVPVAVGGDGTVHVVARALLERTEVAPTMGVLPLGTGNILAHEVGATPIAKAIEALLVGRARSLDLMRTNVREFPTPLITISAGFEGRFIHAYSRQRGPGRLGSAAAMLAGARMLLSAPEAGIRLVLDGVEVLGNQERVWNVGFYLMRRFAFGRLVLPDADPSDGWGEAVVYRTRSAYLAAMARGVRLESSREATDVLYLRWRQATLSSGPTQVDGEPGPAGTMEVNVVHEGLRVLGGGG